MVCFDIAWQRCQQEHAHWNYEGWWERLYSKVVCLDSIYTPKKLTWNLEMMVSNRNLLFQGSIFRFHVCFGGCTLYYTSKKQSRGGIWVDRHSIPIHTFSLPVSNVSARDNFRCLCNFNLRRRWGGAMRDWGGGERIFARLYLIIGFPVTIQGCSFVPYTFSETKPQMGFYGSKYWWNQGLALIHGQIYNPAIWCNLYGSCGKMAWFQTLGRVFAHRFIARFFVGFLRGGVQGGG